MLRVLIVTPNYLPVIGGAELAVHQLALALRRQGHRPAVLCPDLGPLPGGAPYPVWRRAPLSHGGWRANLALWLGRIVVAARRHRADLIHAHYADTAGWAAVATRALHRCPVVLTSHGADLQRAPEIGYGLRLDRSADRRVRSTVARSDALVAISEEIESEMVAAGADARRITRIPNGVDVAWVRRWSGREQQHPVPATRGGGAASDAWTAAEHWTADRSGGAENAPRCRIVAVGRNHPKKGFEVLLRALARIRDRAPGADLVIAGAQTEALQPLVRDLGLENRVRLLGRIPEEGTPLPADHPMPIELARLLGSCDLFCSPSLVEAFPLVNVEAMAAGLPLVLTDISGNREVVGAGAERKGVLVAPGDAPALAEALGALIRDPRRRARFGSQSWEAALAYDWAEIARRHVKVYREVARAASDAPPA